jgi:hypothetical protein
MDFAPAVSADLTLMPAGMFRDSWGGLSFTPDPEPALA